MMSISELMDTARGVTNMYLAHEIAVDKDFMLEKLKPDVQPGSMEEQVKTIVHQAFWDVLASELSEEPPIFNQVCFYFSKMQYVLFSKIVFKVKLATYVSTHPPIVFCALVCINQGHLVFFSINPIFFKCFSFPLSFQYFSGSFFTSYLNHGKVVEPHNI